MPNPGSAPQPEESEATSPGTVAYVDTKNDQADASRVVEQVPQHIGPFQIVEVLGQGGMGIVYLAEQKEPVRRRVALKLIKLGMDTREIISRFEGERQALALMSHPNVAAVLDAGTSPQGRPYFVMEHVPGIPITRYCDTHKLGVEQRLELFIPVCEAVQHAHSKGVIHRDLKPSNVLVMLRDGKPVPKVIDFGLSKITGGGIGEHTLLTHHGQMIGTPAYMSPEQAEMSGLDIDTRTDVYSLGAMLYELLAGASPFDPKSLKQLSYTEVQRVIREVEPVKPSTKVSTPDARTSDTAEKRHVEPHTLVRQLRGDLDWIVLKAMEKDRTRRYATPNELGADIRRHLSHELVVARPPTLTYRASKFVRRHRAPVVAAAVAVVALIGGLIAMTSLYFHADAAKRLAEEHRREAELVNTFLIEDLLAEASPERNPVGGNEVLLKVVDRAAERLDAVLADEPALEAPLRRTLGRTYQMLSRYAEAERQLRLALSGYQRIHGPEDAETLKVMNALVWSLAIQAKSKLEKRAEAKSLSQECLDVCTRALGADHAETLAAQINVAELLSQEGEHVQAEQLFRRVFEARERALGPDQPKTLYAKERMALELLNQERLTDAEAHFRQVLTARERKLGREHPATLYTRHLVVLALSKRGRQAEALPLAQETLQSRRHVLGADHPQTLDSIAGVAGLLFDQRDFEDAEKLYAELAETSARRNGAEHLDTVGALSNLAKVMSARGRLVQAEQAARQALDACRRRDDKDPRYLISALLTVADLQHRQGKLAEAEAQFRQALELRRSRPGEEGLDSFYMMSSLAGLLLDRGNFDAAALAEAEQLCQAALAGRQKRLPATHTSLAASHAAYARILLAKNQPAAAEPYLRDAIKIYEGSPRADNWELFHARNLLGACHAAAGRFAEAEPLLVDGYTALESQLACPPQRRRQALERVVQLYKAWNMPEKAAEWEKKKTTPQTP